MALTMAPLGNDARGWIGAGGPSSRCWERKEDALPSVRDILWRFRRSVTPPGPALVRMAPPADSRTALAAELAPLFEAIDEAGSDLASPDEARDRAAETVRRARAEADGLLRRIDAGLAEVRSDAAHRRREQAGEQIDRIRKEGEAEVARIHTRAESRLPAMVDRVMDCVAGGGRE